MEGQNQQFGANFTLFASLISGFLIVASGFFAGWYWQNASVQDVVKVEIVEMSGKTGPVPTAPVPPAEAVGEGEEPEATENTSPSEGCQFIGSKNSDKYHAPDSGSAKRILPENRVCFASEEEAQEEGYEPGTL